MRFACNAALAVLLFSVLPAWSQQTQQSTSSGVITQDPQAVSVLNQSLAAAGGATAVQSITDFVATGNITYGDKRSSTATVTVSGRGAREFRMDSSLAVGTRTLIFNSGQIFTQAENGTITRLPPQGPIPSSNFASYLTPMFPGGMFFPTLELATVLNGTQYAIFNKGTATLNGQSLLDVQVQRVLPGTSTTASAVNLPVTQGVRVDPFVEHNTIDFFIDPSSFQVVMIQDVISNHTANQLWYSNYKTVNGVLLPFSVSEQFGSQQTWSVQLNQFMFNQGLQDSNFTL